jgi:alginate O-acetyltransferase complex protein AlgI
LPQFSRPFRCSIPMVKEGLFLILLGFIKKVVVADRLARIIEPYYEQSAVDSIQAATCMLLFTCQIYVDFSSYSDIAIGLGLLLGYHIRPNFNLPFVVPSIPERWRRWHISMSHWFRDYIFIPLGGSRKGTVRTQVNIVLVMFLSGLWHGASNNFVVWGLGNGFTMVAHKLLRSPLKLLSSFAALHPVSRVGYYYLCCWNTFCTIATINIFFRCPTWENAQSYVQAIFLSGWTSYLSFLSDPSILPVKLVDGFGWVLAVFALHEGQRYFDLKARILQNPLYWVLTCTFMFWFVITFGIAGPQFIYYQF